MNKNLSYLEKVVLFNEIAGNKSGYNTRQACLYIGLLLEELEELLQSVNLDDTTLSSHLDYYGNQFKVGVFDVEVEKSLKSKDNRVEFLDAVADINVVSIGAGLAVGGDIDGALNAVADNNLSKFNIVDDEYVVIKDGNGKIKKPENYKSVELNQYIGD